MKKIMAYGRHKTSSKLYLVVCLILFNALFTLSCGLETFYSILPPKLSPNYSIPTVDRNDVLSQTFQFETQEELKEGQAFTFMGTEIYYKIYSNQDHMRSEVDALNSSIAESEKNFNSYAADKLIQKDGYGYGYSQLCILDSGRAVPVLIPRKSTFTVSFRLTNSDLDKYKKFITYGSFTSEQPVRITGQPFDFTKSYKPNVIDPNIDKDVYKESQEYKGNDWYVPFFAVSKGRDTTYTNYYSNVLYLGAVKIDGTKAN